MKRQVVAASLTGAVSIAALTACVNVAVEDDPPPKVIDVMSPPPGSRPLPTNRAAFDKELRTLSRVLQGQQPGKPESGRAASRACLRIGVLRRGLAVDGYLQKVGVNGLERTQLGIAGVECRKEPRKAARELRAIARGEIRM